MSESERLQAEHLDAHITALQSAQRPPVTGGLPRAETDLLAQLHEVALEIEPSPRFTAQLENQLRATARARAATRGREPVRVWPALRRSAMDTRAIASLAAAAVLVVMVVVALPQLRPAVQHVTPPAALTPTVPQTSRPATVPMAQVPTSTAEVPPAPVIEEPSALPRLAALTGMSGSGGGAGAARLRYELKVDLPEGPARMPIYQVVTPAAPTAAEVLQVAHRLGMQPNLYEGLCVFDGPRELVFEPQGYAFHYRDQRYSCYYQGHWYPLGAPLTAEESVAVARTLLENQGLLGFPYALQPPRFAGAPVEFLRMAEGGWPVLPAVASVEVGAEGQVGDISYRRLELAKAGEFAIITAQQAWELASNGQPGDRLLYRTYPPAHCNPRYWAREWGLDQRADLFGTPQVSLPVDRALPPRVKVGDVLLSGDLQPLAAYAQSQHAQEQPAWVHVWGAVQDTDGVRSVRVEGWEALTSEPLPYMGTIRHTGDQGSLLTGDGRTLTMADLPSDLADGASVFVDGGELDGRLEWTLIQASTPDGLGCAPEPAAEALASVESVELVYFVPSAQDAGPLSASAPVYTQPIWRFAGKTDNGLLFEVWVQAVTEANLR